MRQEVLRHLEVARGYLTERSAQGGFDGAGCHNVEAPALARQRENQPPTVIGIAAPTDQTATSEALENARQRAWMEMQDFRETTRRDAWKPADEADD
jgi:hypothetical protein